MTTYYNTAGEQITQRELEIEKRSGIDHYVVGQHYAKIVGDDIALYAELSYVGLLGQAVALLCRKRPDGKWEAASEYVRRASILVDHGVGKLPDEFPLSPSMVEALDEAEIRYEEKLSGGQDG